jgi:hypothetical protein
VQALWRLLAQCGLLTLNYTPEKQLIETENNLRNDSTSWWGSSHNVLHPKIGHIANEGTSRSRVSKTIAPEHPLESSHCGYHQTLKQKSQSGLSSCETAIEKSDAGNDQPHDEAAKD